MGLKNGVGKDGTKYSAEQIAQMYSAKVAGGCFVGLKDGVDEDGKTLLYRSAQSVVVCTVGFPVSFRSTLSEVRLLTRGPPREESSGPFSAHYSTFLR